MKKLTSLTIVILLTILTSESAQETFRAYAQPNEKLQILTSIKPLQAIVMRIAKEHASVDVLLKDAQSIHGLQLKPSDISAIENADSIIIISDQLETNIAKALKNATRQQMQIQAATLEGVTTYSFSANHDTDSHEHDDHHNKTEEQHDEHPNEDHHTHDDIKFDPHIWLSIDNTIAITSGIAHNLATKAPHLAQQFENNANIFIAELEKLKVELTQSLNSASKPYLVYHDAYQYFEKEFQLKNMGIISKNVLTGTNAKHLQELREKIKNAQIACIFSEPQFNNKATTNLAEEFGIKSIEIDPLGSAIPADENFTIEFFKALATGFSSC